MVFNYSTFLLIALIPQYITLIPTYYPISAGSADAALETSASIALPMLVQYWHELGFSI